MISAAALGRRDIGRLIMVPIAAIVLLYDVRLLVHPGALARPGDAVLRFVGTALTCLFYALIIVSYLRRGPAIATHRSITGWAVAVIATMAPFPLPFLYGSPPGTARQAAADLLLLAGTTCSVWALGFLGRNLSVIAQARAVTDRGPYRLVRHPLYAGEMLAALGLALAVGTLAAFAVWLILCAMQAYRAWREEEILLQALPAYRQYRERTPALVPGLFWLRS